MKYKPYPAYKDSGVEWLGEIPEAWATDKSRRVFQEINERSVDGSETLLSVSEYYGVKPRQDVVEEGEHLSRAESLEDYKKCKPNDLVMNIMLAWKRGLGFSCFDGIVSPAYSVFRLLGSHDPIFLNYLLRTDIYTSEFRRHSTGVIDSRLRLYPEVFKGIDILLPPSAEQTIIATFLDHETARLDTLIAKQSKLIDLLQEKRQALISHAVTKGLNPDAPMKDSGVAWLGEVPAHWEVTPIKHIVSVPVTDGPHETPEFLDEGVPFVSAEAVSTGKIDFEKIRGFISAEDHRRYSLKYSPRIHDIYMVKSGATTGVSAIVETASEFNIWSPLAVIRCGDAANPYFILNVIRSRNFQESVALNWSFGTQQNIGMGVIQNLPVPIPPLEEQAEIASYIGAESNKLDTLIEKSRRSIELMREHRTALISAAVTGKIDVRAQHQAAA